MLKKVASMGFVAFFGFGLVANICLASNKDGNAPAKWMGFVSTKISDEYSTCDGDTTDYYDNDKYSTYDGSTTDCNDDSTTDYYDDGEYSVYDDSTTDYNYDGSNEDSSYYDNDDDSKTDSYYDSSNATEVSRVRQIEEQRTNKNILVAQRFRPLMWGSLHNKRDSDEDYFVNEEALQAEQDREDKDLEDMKTTAVWERRKK